MQKICKKYAQIAAQYAKIRKQHAKNKDPMCRGKICKIYEKNMQKICS